MLQDSHHREIEDILVKAISLALGLMFVEACSLSVLNQAQVSFTDSSGLDLESHISATNSKIMWRTDLNSPESQLGTSKVSIDTHTATEPNRKHRNLLSRAHWLHKALKHGENKW